MKRRCAEAAGAESGEPIVSGILIIGYGNVLRGDDAVGVLAAHQLEQKFSRDPEVKVIACQQLTPEMADDISGSELVIFLDASYSEEPGTVRCKPLSADNASPGFTHDVSPEWLVAAAEQLYGDMPKAMSLTLSGWSFDAGRRLSGGAQRCLPELVRQANELISMHRKSQPVMAGSQRS